MSLSRPWYLVSSPCRWYFCSKHCRRTPSSCDFSPFRLKYYWFTTPPSASSMTVRISTTTEFTDEDSDRPYVHLSVSQPRSLTFSQPRSLTRPTTFAAVSQRSQTSQTDSGQSQNFHQTSTIAVTFQSQATVTSRLPRYQLSQPKFTSLSHHASSTTSSPFLPAHNQTPH